MAGRKEAARAAAGQDQGGQNSNPAARAAEVGSVPIVQANSKAAAALAEAVRAAAEDPKEGVEIVFCLVCVMASANDLSQGVKN